MKRIFSLILTILMILPLATGVFATENTPGEEEITAKTVAVTGITLPSAGKAIPQNPESGAKVEIWVSKTGKDVLEKYPSSFISASWSEKDKPGTPIKSGNFVTGRTYRLTVTLEFQEAPKVKDQYTEFTVNGEKAQHLSNKGVGEIQFYCDFAATPGDFTPKVSVETKGEKVKEYDGKAITLTAKVEKMEGIDYSYTWYKNGSAVKDETGESIQVKNVAQSGEYTCKVTAFIGSPDSGTFKTTMSSAVKVDISRHTIIVKIEDAKKDLFGKDPEFTYTLKGDIYDQLQGKPEREEGEEAGTYPIGIGTLSFEKDVADNYDLQVEEGTFTVESTDEIPFVTLKNFADQSYIVGKNNAKIRLSITKGALPEGAVVTLALPEADAKEGLEETEEKKILKSFAVKLLDEDGKELSLPKKAALRMMIPLTEEEEKNFDAKTITCALYHNGVSALSGKLVKEGKVSYIVLETEELGTVALFEGKSLVPATSSEKGEKKEKSGGALLWVLIALASILSVGAIGFTLWQIRKTDKKPAKAPVKKTAPTPEEQKEKERRRRIAEELNALPPVPEKAKTAEVPTAENMETRAFTAVGEDMAEKTIKVDPIPESPAEKTIVVDPVPENPAEKTIQVPEEVSGPISFEDLED